MTGVTNALAIMTLIVLCGVAALLMAFILGGIIEWVNITVGSYLTERDRRRDRAVPRETQEK